MTSQPFHGVLVPVLTPFTRSGDPDAGALCFVLPLAARPGRRWAGDFRHDQRSQFDVRRASAWHCSTGWSRPVSRRKS